MTHSQLCWKRCGQTGTLADCWWKCDMIRAFWLDILTQIYKIMGHKVPLKAELVFLDLWEKLSISTSRRDLISSLLVAAKISIVLLWEPLSVPTKSLWYRKIQGQL